MKNKQETKTTTTTTTTTTPKTTKTTINQCDLQQGICVTYANSATIGIFFIISEFYKACSYNLSHSHVHLSANNLLEDCTHDCKDPEKSVRTIYAGNPFLYVMSAFVCAGCKNRMNSGNPSSELILEVEGFYFVLEASDALTLGSTYCYQHLPELF
uniref:Uncharacterized protein n=1 Tax=Glossina austeni TaxID=7395 RepID=A0A1A9V9T3_GLOAU